MIFASYVYQRVLGFMHMQVHQRQILIKVYQALITNSSDTV